MSTKITKNTGREALEEFGPKGTSDTEKKFRAPKTDATIAAETFPSIGTAGPAPRTGSQQDKSNLQEQWEKVAQPIEEFQFLECDPIDLGEVVEECPLCVPNEYAYVPNYRMMPNGNIFFDGKQCTQNIVLTVKSPVLNGPNSSELKSKAFQKEQKEEGIRLILDYFNRADTATVFYYVEEPPQSWGAPEVVASTAGVAGGILGAALGAEWGGFGGMYLGSILGASTSFFAAGMAGQLLTPPDVTGYTMVSEERDVVKELLKYTEFDYSIPIQQKARTRILISVPVEFLNRVPSRLETEPTAEFETTLEVEFEGREFFPKFRRSIKALKHYANRHDSWVALDGGAFVELNTTKREFLDLRSEAGRLELFRDNIAEMVKEGTGLTFRGFNQLEKIKFKFEEEPTDSGHIKYRLKQVLVNKPGCPDIIFSDDSDEFGTKGLFKSYMKKTPFSMSRTLYYVGAMVEMDLALMSREKMPWIEFITKFTYPGLEVYYGGDNVMDLSLAECFAASATGDEDMDAFMAAMMDIGLGIPDAIIAKFMENTCKTEEEWAKEMAKIGKGEEWEDFKTEYAKQKERVKQERTSKIAGNDPWLKILFDTIGQQKTDAEASGAAFDKAAGLGAPKDRKEEKARKNMPARKKKIKDERDFWADLNNNLGRCGWMALIFTAIDCVAQGLGQESAMDVLVNAAFDAMNDAHLERLLVGLDPETQKEIQALAEEELGHALTILPWDPEYAAGSYAGEGFRLSELIDDMKEAKAEKKRNEALDALYMQGLQDRIPELEEWWLEQWQDAGYTNLGEDDLPDFENMSAEDLDSQLMGMDVAPGGFLYTDPEPEDAQESIETGEQGVDTPEEYQPSDYDIYGDEILNMGDTGELVKAMQDALLYLGYDLSSYGADGIFGAETEEALEDFQKWAHDLGIPMGDTAGGTGVDGDAGPFTASAFEIAWNMKQAADQGLEYNPLDAGDPEIPEETEEAETGEDEFSFLDNEDGEGLSDEDLAAYEALTPEGVAEATASAAVSAPASGSEQGVFDMGYSQGEFSFGAQSEGSGGTYGTALGNVWKATVDAYRNAILKSVGVDHLLNELNKLPGAPIVASLIKHYPCKPTPLWEFDPRIDSFLNTLEADICEWQGEIAFDFNPKPIAEGKRNIFVLMKRAIIEVIKEVALAIMMQVMKLLLSKIFSMICDAIATLGASLLDLFSGSDHFRDMLKDNLCPDATEEDIYDALANIADAVTGPEADCLERLTNADLSDFIDDVSLMLTQGQVIDLITGNASQETLALAMELASVSDSEAIQECFADPASIQGLFDGLGVFIPNLDDYIDAFGPDAYDRPTNPCPPETAEKIDDLRCELLGSKGLSKKECREMIDDLKDQAVQDLKDLADLLENGPFSNMPPLEGTGDCPEDGFYPSTDPMMAAMDADLSAGLLEPIETKHIRDMIGSYNWFTKNMGVLNAVMSDTKGRPWKLHNWAVATFGSPMASDLGFFEWTSDNAIKAPEGSPGRDKIPMDIHGQDLSGDEGKGISFFGYSEGGFPPTVGAWMAKTLREVEPQFHTIVVPGGFETVDAALKEYNRIQKINDRRVENRKQYVEAFIDEFKLDDGGNKGVHSDAKLAQAASEMRAAVADKLFDPNNLQSDPGHKLYTGAQYVWNICDDRDISVAWQSIGRNVDKWSQKNQNKAGTNGKSFIEYWGDKAPLLEVPDTSSADIKITFQDYGDNPTDPEDSTPLYEFDIEYDYNMFDDTGVLAKDGTYNFRIVRRYNNVAASAGDPLTRREMKRAGGGAPPASILGGTNNEFVAYDIKAKSKREPEMEEFLDELGVLGDEVEDSYQVEGIYKFVTNLILEKTDNVLVANTLLEDKAIRDYFAKRETVTETSTFVGSISEKSTFDSISNGFLKRICFNISSGMPDILYPSEDGETDPEPGFLEPPPPEDDLDLSGGEEEQAESLALDLISPAFKYGFDPFVEPEVEFLDAETYGGTFAKIAIAMGRDPSTVPQPYYIKEPALGGWMGMAQALIPEVDGCDPARTELFDLSDLASTAADLADKIVPDHRLEYDPLCGSEAPYDKILESYVAGNIEAAIRANLRIYILDIFLKGIPAFVMFGLTEENYDDLLENFMAEIIKAGLINEGSTQGGPGFRARTDETYYYRVLEQCFNNVVRKVDSGLLDYEKDLNAAEKEAFEIIVSSVQKFYDKYEGELEALPSSAISGQSIMRKWMSTPASSKATGLGAGSADFSKSVAKAAKELAWKEAIEETEEQAFIFLKRYMREEYNSIVEMFSQKIPSFVYNIHHLFLLSNGWCHGGVYGDGPFNVQSDPSDPNTYNISVGVAPTLAEAAEKMRNATIGGMEGIFTEAADNLEASAIERNKDWPFVLEKYIRIENKTQVTSDNAEVAAVNARDAKLHGIVNIEDWDGYVRDLKSQDYEGDISEFWGDAPLSGETAEMLEHTHNYEIDASGNGITSTHIDEEGNEHYHIIENGVLTRAVMNEDDNGHKHNIEITGWKFGLRLSYIVSPEKAIAFEPAFNTIGEDTIVQEKSYRLETPEGPRIIFPIASAELPIPDQDFTLFDPASYDVYCLIEELIKTTEYKYWFKYLFPLSRFTSLMAIYVSQGFYASMGNAGWPINGGDMWETPGGNKRWGPSFRRWSRGDHDTFSKSKNEARDVFTSLYDSASSMAFETENKYGYKDSPTSVRDFLRPRANFDLGLRWWQTGPWIKSRPYDKDGNEC
jgi:peptidoglycan hydrolase-like protein with peptidoglycan-binding domain